jgi:calcineurin-like phosphoesterase family protein
METTYLVEIRLGRTKWRIKEIIREIAITFHIEEYMEQHPHVTLFGPFVLNDGVSPQTLLETIAATAARFDPIPFIIDGWDRREGMHGSVIAFKILPSAELQKINREIVEVLSPIVQSQIVWDATPENKWFHATIANRLDTLVASDVFSRISGQKPTSSQNEASKNGIIAMIRSLLGKVKNQEPARIIPPVLLDETGLRLTVMQDKEILAEYDFLEKRWITGGYSHNNKSWQKTLAEYRHFAGLERSDPVTPDPDDIFLTADLHLGHANIIRYCSRPFLASDVKEMDHVLIKNWNYTVAPVNQVYYLGDFTYSSHIQDPNQYRKKLRGRITFIRGNHDKDELTTVPSVGLEKDGIRFLLVHDPADAPKDFDGWVIHGHHHNNDLRNFPFIDFENRRINISAEVAGYIPVTLQEICSYIQKNEYEPGERQILLNYPRTPR